MQKRQKHKRNTSNVQPPPAHLQASLIEQTLGQIRLSRTISRSQHLYLVSSLLANDSEAQPYRELINQILEATQSGTLQLTD